MMRSRVLLDEIQGVSGSQQSGVFNISSKTTLILRVSVIAGFSDTIASCVRHFVCLRL